ncbi:MAG: TIGR02281 family clan AA aspartic protease [Gammaproteobacteria bacterium]|jgi:aspartyl protease family protein
MSRQQDPATSPLRIGKGMIVAAWILLLVMLTWFFNNRLEHQYNPNANLANSDPDGGVPEVRLKRNRHGHYVATGAINGQPVEFMLDTGASDVSIPAAVAQRLGLERGQPLYYQTANGTVTAWQTLVDEIRLGRLRLGPVRASINPNFNGEAVLLGMSFLRELDFSQQGDTLTLSYPDPAAR